MVCASAALGCPRVLAQTHPAAEASGPVISIDEAVARACDDGLTVFDRFAALNVVVSHSDQKSLLGLRSIVAAAHQDIAVVAARSLLASDGGDVGALIASRVGNWSDQNQRVILETLLQTPRLPLKKPGLLDIPRRILKDLVASRQSPRPTGQEVAGFAVDHAAVLLVTLGPTAEDRGLLRNAVEIMPESQGLWLAMARMGGVMQSQHEVARRVYSDASLSRPVRVAAAIAVAPQDEQADQLAFTLISEFLGQAESIDSLFSSPAEVRERGGLQHFLKGLSMIGAIRFWHTSSAKKAAIQCVGSGNQEIRSLALLLAAERWPEELLSSDVTPSVLDKHADQVAMVVLLNPELKPAIRAKVNESILDAAVKRLQDSGGALGSIYLGVISSAK